MDADAVSVVVPVRNGADSIAEAVESALSQTRPPREVVVVDDGSEDDLAAALAPFRGRITVLRNAASRGVSAARNRAIEITQGEWLAFLDADDVWRRRYLERLLAAAAGRPEVGAVYCDAEVVGGRSLPSRLQAQDWSSCLTPHPPRGHVFTDLLTGPCFATPSATIVRREAAVRAGLFGDGLVGGEDRDLWLRLAVHWQFEFVPEALVRWRARAGNEPRLQKARLPSEYMVFRRARSYSPEEYRSVWPQVRRRLSAVCFELGWLYLDDGERAAARRWFLRGARYLDRLLFKDVLYLGATLLPRTGLSRLRHLKRHVAGIREEPA